MQPFSQDNLHKSPVPTGLIAFIRETCFPFSNPSFNIFAKFFPALGVAGVTYIVPELTSNFICVVYTTIFGLNDLNSSLKLLQTKGITKFIIYQPIELGKDLIAVVLYMECHKQYRAKPFLNEIAGTGFSTYFHMQISLAPRPKKAVAYDILQHMQCIVKGFKKEQIMHPALYCGISSQKNLNIRSLINAVEILGVVPPSFERIVSPK